MSTQDDDEDELKNRQDLPEDLEEKEFQGVLVELDNELNNALLEFVSKEKKD